MQTDLNSRLFCAICSKQIDLISAELDTHGKTVHRECHEFMYSVVLDEERYVA